jgi:hypothetical protein
MTVQGLSGDVDYVPSVTALRDSEQAVIDAHFSSEVTADAGTLSLYCQNLPTTTINLFVAFAEI